MHAKFTLLIALTLTGAVAVGCGSPVREETIEVKASNDPLHLPRSVLQRYAEGQPLGSEVTSFPYMVAQVRESDPARADVLEQGLKELEEAPAGARQAKAQELLTKLQPSMQ